MIPGHAAGEHTLGSVGERAENPSAMTHQI
jgi:hypothetical protein